MHFYRDPAEVYERTEAATCKGCEHESPVKIGTEKFMICGKNKKYGRRCKHYVERNA
jgi:hypothetical protein